MTTLQSYHISLPYITKIVLFIPSAQQVERRGTKFPLNLNLEQIFEGNYHKDHRYINN